MFASIIHIGDTHRSCAPATQKESTGETVQLARTHQQAHGLAHGRGVPFTRKLPTSRRRRVKGSVATPPMPCILWCATNWQMSTSAWRRTTGQPRTSSVTEIAGHWTGLTGSDAAHLLLSVLPATRGIPTVGFAESLSLVIPSTSPEPPVTWIIPVVSPTYDSQPQRTPYLSAQSRPFGIMYVTHTRSSQQTGP